MTDQPTASKHPPAQCSVCEKSRRVRPDPSAIQTQLVCMHNPPQVVAIQAGNQVHMQTLFPIVADTMSCYQFKPVAQVAANH